MTAQRPRVLVADAISPVGLEPLHEAGIEVLDRSGISAEDLMSEIADCEGLLVRSRTKVTPQILEAATKLRVIGRAGTGVDNVDLDAATRAGVVVMNVPGGNAAAAAEHTIALMTGLARHVAPAAASLREGAWERKRYVGIELAGRTIGVVGFGRIGRAVARRARGLLMNVLVSDPLLTPEGARDAGFELVDLGELVQRVDFLTVHVPKGDATHHLVGRELLAKAKPGLRVLNVARGGIVDEDALLEALEDGRVAGAGLDVFNEEPPTDRRLVEHPNVLATPHLGASTEEAQLGVAIAVARQVARFLGEGVVLNAVNVTGVAPEAAERLAPWLALSRRLGRVGAALAGGRSAPKALELTWFGDELSQHVAAMVPDALVGLLQPYTATELNPVNARVFAQQHGLETRVAQGGAVRGWPEGLGLTIDHGDGSRTRLTGVVSARGDARLVDLLGQAVDLSLMEPLLVVRNEDRPGVIAHLSAALAEASLNIAQMSVSRGPVAGRALTVIGLDEVPDEKLQASLADHPQIESLVTVRL